MRITSRFWIHASVCAPSSHGRRLWHNHSSSNDVYSVSQKTPLNAGVKLGQRLQRWTNFNLALRQLLVLGQPYFSAANSPLDAYDYRRIPQSRYTSHMDWKTWNFNKSEKSGNFKTLVICQGKVREI